MIKTTLITGSTKGIGKQIGLDLLDKGEFVIFTGRTSESCQTLSDYLKRNSYKNFYCFQVDFSDWSGIVRLSEYIKEKQLILHNLILNVGTTCRKSFTDITLQEWNEVFNTNLTYPFFFIQWLLPIIRNRIIFIGSVLGHVPSSVSIPYGVSKGSLEILTKYLAKELAHKKITVNTVAPGFIETDWHSGKPEEQLNRIRKQNLLRRLGTPEEISKAVQFIIDNEYVNGQTISVDGGFHFE